MNWHRHMIIWMSVFCLWTVPSQAALLDPWVFASLGTLNTSDAINTDTLQLTGGASYTGVLDPVSGASIFAFDDIAATNLSIFGTRSLGLLSKGNIAFTGMIDVLGDGGLEMGAIGSLAMKDVSALGSGGDIILHANQITLSGSITATTRLISIASPTDIMFVGGSGGQPVPIPNPGAITPVPLSASFLLFGSGLASLGLVRRRIA